MGLCTKGFIANVPLHKYKLKNPCSPEQFLKNKRNVDIVT